MELGPSHARLLLGKFQQSDRTSWIKCVLSTCPKKGASLAPESEEHSRSISGDTLVPQRVTSK